ncbi:MAG: DUF3311 domain-containing protein [Planctomycetaceae bacterium]|nr:DUF3311 domain-containing protein [Planctomycetaceae bacterium]
MKYVVWGMVLFLLIIHQDNWLWENNKLVFGFFPIALLYHAGISILAAITWYMATIFAWPIDEDEEQQIIDQEGAAQ